MTQDHRRPYPNCPKRRRGWCTARSGRIMPEGRLRADPATQNEHWEKGGLAAISWVGKLFRPSHPPVMVVVAQVAVMSLAMAVVFTDALIHNARALSNRYGKV